MHFLRHRCVRPAIGKDHALSGKVVYIPAMAEGSVELFASIFRWLGIDAYATPPSDARTLELGAKYTGGDECYPAKVTVGDFMKLVESRGFDPKRTVYFMATANGPCRFGQYAVMMRKILREAGYGDVLVLGPRTEQGYGDLGNLGNLFVRGAWRALVCGDILRKLLLQTRPYEMVPGAADQAFRESVMDVCETLENNCADWRCHLRTLLQSLGRAGERFRNVPARYDPERPLIGIVGEIFCRLNNFSNFDLVRRLEKHGAECWMTDIAEWVAYTNSQEARDLRLTGHRFSLAMLKSRIRHHIQEADLELLLELFEKDFEGYDEARIETILKLAHPYLPWTGAEGEMVVSVGRAAYLATQGVDGIVDISPFSCMNGIVSEAMYPRLSRDYGGIPIRNFYFDGTQADLDRDLVIYLELARSYRERKTWTRRLPGRFVTEELGATRMAA
jgi:predicted nucleotide-binding protein (sugar kinase/HSP70/actin superfamily)